LTNGYRGGVESETAETLFCKFSKSEEETI